jgi:hypothetical protein
MEHDGDQIPLESEPTAALAASLAESRFWKTEMQIFLGNAIGIRRASAPIPPESIPACATWSCSAIARAGF